MGRLLVVSQERSARGCNKRSDYRTRQRVSVRAGALQVILTKHGRGSQYERFRRLEARHLQEDVALSAAQVGQIEAANPPFRERHGDSSRPAELPGQDSCYVGRLKGVGKLYLHRVVDTYRSVASGSLYPRNLPEAAGAVCIPMRCPSIRSAPGGGGRVDRHGAGVLRRRPATRARCTCR